MVKRAMVKLVIFVLIFSAKTWARWHTVKPNIIFILADDLGWNDVSFHGSNLVSTPNIDVMGLDGIVLNNYYVTPICTPSRGAFMTGKYPIRIGLQHSVLKCGEPRGLPLNEVLLPQYLKQMNYSTHGVGKWHLGYFKDEYLPSRRGFDTFFGNWEGGIDYFTHTYNSGANPEQECRGIDLHSNEESEKDYNGEYSTELYTRKATEIIQNHNYRQNPLFLYLAYNAVHTGMDGTPLQEPYQYTNSFTHIKDRERQKFAGMVASLDDSVGEIIQSLDETGVLDNTIIVFSTDNGGAVKGFMEGTGSNFPLRGAKEFLFEGGTRGVGWIWSSKLRRSATLNELMHITDWLPTLYAAAGGNIENLFNLDGYNQWPTILGLKKSPRDEMLYGIDPILNNYAIRVNQYKLLYGDNGRNIIFDYWFNSEGSLYNSTESYYLDVNQGTTRNFRLENVNRMLSTSFKILLRKYGYSVISKIFSHSQSRDLIVDCRLNRKHIYKTCSPREAPCLFNIEEDPCELNNLAQELPEIVANLKKHLDVYHQNVVPPNNKEYDSRSNPKFYDYYLTPWMSPTHQQQYKEHLRNKYLADYVQESAINGLQSAINKS